MQENSTSLAPVGQDAAAPAPKKKAVKPPPEPSVKLMDIERIIVDLELQSRVDYHKPTIVDYVEVYKSKTKLPPVDVFYDGGECLLAGGFHRVAAAKKAGRKLIDVRVHQGDKNDAIAFSVGQNHDHGLRRTNADKRRAVKMLLSIPRWAIKSDRLIASQCNVSDKLVASIRPEPTAESRSSTTRVGRDGKKRKVPKKKAKPVPATPEPVPIEEAVDDHRDQPDTVGLTCPQCGGAEFDADGCCVPCNADDDLAADDPLLEDEPEADEPADEQPAEEEPDDAEPEDTGPSAGEDYFDTMIRAVRRAANHLSPAVVVETLERLIEEIRGE